MLELRFHPVHPLAVLLAALLGWGCAHATKSAPQASSSVAEAPVATAVTAEPTAATVAEGTTEPIDLVTPEPPPRPGLRELCKQDATQQDAAVDSAQRWLEETFCGATLWLDGLLGGEPNVESARKVSGRVELSGLYTEHEGFDPKARLRVRYQLPNLERRFNLFLGREDQDEFIEDRSEGPSIRSSVFGLEREEKWLAGLGYAPPGRWAERIDFRLGARVKSAPVVFVQGRYRRNFFVGEDVVWRFRESVFYENRAGFGSTTSLDYDHVLKRDLLFRWGNVATVSEDTDGASWRSAVVLYKNLRKSRGLAGELFARGETKAPVDVWEYGSRGVFRFPLGRRDLFAEAIVGYTWPVVGETYRREGSPLVGIGIELLFGSRPY